MFSSASLSGAQLPYYVFFPSLNTHLGTECSKELDVRVELFSSIGKSLKICNFIGIHQVVSVDQPLYEISKNVDLLLSSVM